MPRVSAYGIERRWGRCVWIWHTVSIRPPSSGWRGHISSSSTTPRRLRFNTSAIFSFLFRSGRHFDMRTVWIGLLSSIAFGTVVDRVAVVVGGTVITESEVLREVR